MENPLGAGRLAGMRTHRLLMRESATNLPLIIDDRQATMLIEHVAPQNLSREDIGHWRAGWLEGWFRVSLQEALSLD